MLHSMAPTVQMVMTRKMNILLQAEALHAADCINKCARVWQNYERSAPWCKCSAGGAYIVTDVMCALQCSLHGCLADWQRADGGYAYVLRHT